MYDDEIDWSDSSLPAADPPEQLLSEEEQRLEDEVQEILAEYESVHRQDQPPQRRDSAATTEPPATHLLDVASQQPDQAVEQPDVVPSIEKEMHDAPHEQSSPRVDIDDNVDHEMPDAPEELEEGQLYEYPLLGRSRHESPRYLERLNRGYIQERWYHRPVRQYPPEPMLERGTILATHTPSSVLLLMGLGGSDTAVALLRVALQLVAEPLTRGPSGLLPTNKPISAIGAPRGSLCRVLLVRDKEREWSVSYGFAEFDSVEVSTFFFEISRLDS